MSKLRRIAPALLGLLLMPLPVLAQGSSLRFDPVNPTAGERAEVAYRPAAALAGEAQLQLRARLRTAADGEYSRDLGSRTVATLLRQQDGSYRGTLELPAEVVFAVFAVEDAEATHVDSREGRYWEFVVHGRDGSPSFDALQQRFNDYMGRDMREVLAAARQAVSLHPDEPHALNLLHAAETWTAGSDERAALRERHREQAVRLLGRVATRTDLSAAELVSLAMLAHETAVRDELRQRLLAEHPGHASSIIHRTEAALGVHKDDPGALLGALEQIWTDILAAPPPTTRSEAEVRTEFVVHGVRAAARADLADDALRWLDRLLEGSAPSWLIAELLRSPPLRERGLAMARQEITRQQQVGDDQRALGQTAAEHRRTNEQRVGNLQAIVGRALLGVGQHAEALPYLSEGARRSPSTPNLRGLGEAALLNADTALALEAFARIAAHPATSLALVDSLRIRLGAAFDGVRWEETLSTTRAALIEQTHTEAVARPLPTDLKLTTADGSATSLAQLTDGARATVVVFVSRYCDPSTRAMPQVQRLAESLRGEGVVFVLVTTDALADDYADAIRAAGTELAIHHDTTSETALAFNTYGTPQFFVVDSAGVVRFEQSSPTQIPLQLLALP